MMFCARCETRPAVRYGPGLYRPWCRLCLDLAELAWRDEHARFVSPLRRTFDVGERQRLARLRRGPLTLVQGGQR